MNPLSSKINRLTLVLASLAVIPAVSQAVTLDIRGGYKAGSHSYESRFKVSESWDNGWWASIETDNKNNKNNNRGKDGADKSDAAHSFGDTTVDYNELETNYIWKFAKDWNLQPGGIYHWSSKGSQLRPYVRLNYKITPDLTSGIRYRYDYNNYTTINSEGAEHRDSVNRLDLFLSYKLTPVWTVSWQGTAYRHTNSDYRYKNDKASAIENAFILRYKWNKYFSPYVEYDYLDKQGSHEGETKLHESRYRIGATFYL